MRKIFLLAIAATMLLGTALAAQAHDAGPGYRGSYRGDMMGPGYGPGYMMGPGYGPGYMMGPGYGPGMMYGYGPGGRRYRRGDVYRGKQLCWRATGDDAGYYASCRK